MKIVCLKIMNGDNLISYAKRIEEDGIQYIELRDPMLLVYEPTRGTYYFHDWLVFMDDDSDTVKILANDCLLTYAIAPTIMKRYEDLISKPKDSGKEATEKDNEEDVSYITKKGHTMH